MNEQFKNHFYKLQNATKTIKDKNMKFTLLEKIIYNLEWNGYIFIHETFLRACVDIFMIFIFKGEDQRWRAVSELSSRAVVQVCY